MPARARSRAAKRVMSRPSSLMLPPSGRSAPAIRLKSDDLPAPLGPMIPRAVPASIARSTLSATTTEPKDFDRFSVCRITRRSPTRFRQGTGGGSATSRLIVDLVCDRFHLAANRNLRGVLVVDDDQFVIAVVLQAP